MSKSKKKGKSSRPPQELDPADSRRVAHGLALIGILINLLLANDYATIWHTAELQQLQIVDQSFEKARQNLPQLLTWILGATDSLTSTQFIQRLPSVLLLLLLLWLCWRPGRKLWGGRPSVVFLLVLGSSLGLPLVFKWATADAWLITFLGIQPLFLLAHLKQEAVKWKLGYWLCSLLAFTTAALPTLLFGLASGLILLWLHPQGGRLQRLYFWIGWPALLLITVLIGIPLQYPDNLYFSMWNHPEITGIAWVAGLIPWLGFLPAGLAEMIRGLRQKEEMAVFSLSWLAAGLLTGTAVAWVPLLFICARQSLRYFQPGHPFEKWTKGSFILLQTTLFLLLLWFILQSVGWFKGLGFRTSILITLMLWMPGFIAIIGLFSRKRSWTFTSLVFSGIVTALLWWGLYQPVWESVRYAPRSIVEKAWRQDRTVLQTSGLSDEAEGVLGWYARRKRLEVTQNSAPDVQVFIQGKAAGQDSSFRAFPWWNVQLPQDTVWVKGY